MFYFQTDERLHTAALCAEKIHELFAVKYLKSIDFTPHGNIWMRLSTDVSQRKFNHRRKSK